MSLDRFQDSIDNRQEPEDRNWREVGPRPEVLEGEDLYHELVRLLQKRRRKREESR